MPIRNQSHVVGDTGESMTILTFQKFGWTADKISSDYGEDISCNIFVGGQRTNLYFRCQVKSTETGSSYVSKLKNGDYSVSVSSSNVSMWLQCLFPVLLIVYDKSKDQLFYGNPVDEIISNTARLKKSTIKIRISSKNKLSGKTKSAIYSEINTFYQKLLRFDVSVFKCEFYPVIMPSYRMIPDMDFEFPLNKNTELKKIYKSIDELPSWMGVLEKLGPSPWFKGYEYSAQVDDLKAFIDCLHTIVNVKYDSLKEDEWLSFVFSPISIQSIEHNGWEKEMTYWETYSLINYNLISDYEIAFKTPNYFLNQIQRRSRSWEYFHKIDESIDVAIQFFADYKVTPSIIRKHLSHYNSTLAQFILWECSLDEIEILSHKLAGHDLSIRIIDDSNSKSILLAITTPLFNPSFGLYSLPKSWDEYDNGIVKDILCNDNFINELPGEEYLGELPDVLNEALSRHRGESRKSVMISEKDYNFTIPLNHSMRSIWISKFVLVESINESEIDEKIDAILAKYDIPKIEIKYGLITDYPEKTCEFRIELTPNLNASSIETYEGFKDQALLIFNKMMSSVECLVREKNMSTYDIVRFFGEIKFEEPKYSPNADSDIHTPS